jgi:hypothetical protein
VTASGGWPLAREERVDSYIVRIYRRDRTRQKGLVGIVEKVGAADKRVFSDRDELWRILSAQKRRPQEERRPTR